MAIKFSVVVPHDGAARLLRIGPNEGAVKVGAPAAPAALVAVKVIPSEHHRT
jgi:hypothetical protein